MASECVGGMAGAVAGWIAGVPVLDGTLPDCNTADVFFTSDKCMNIIGIGRTKVL